MVHSTTISNPLPNKHKNPQTHPRQPPPPPHQRKGNLQQKNKKKGATIDADILNELEK